MASVDQCEEFSAFCQQRSGSDDGEGVYLDSKTVMVSKGRIIVALFSTASGTEGCILCLKYTSTAQAQTVVLTEVVYLIFCGYFWLLYVLLCACNLIVQFLNFIMKN